ncbi:family A G protein-coupled receptor-like protein [Conidiobolus coronatus NRRL 28638]|uniref:Family A G protein-coupled receptor-like protein n=1 Tax=Conidiobolus coronatus (strain ATCC 28846 / CBS 209.66 / NRRL 28638) TaxID=796925 RepID=A0A137NR91_CONC2|nr:family A G protein-coupled receptor-like protein [Conidiobolus coronatus NRRL 28638]|eukprot:KXN65242.1 family A G protein-coupled receptor-like protein [Conidiobolus coronatus NRRL 28638]
MNELEVSSLIFDLLFILFSLLMFIFNGILLYILLKRCDLKHPELKIILILWFVEILSAIKFLGIGIGKLSGGFNWLKINTIQCYLYATLFNWVGKAEMVIVTILALLRYLIVCHKLEKSFKFWLVAIIIGIIPSTVVYIYAGVVGDAMPSVTLLYCSPFTQPGRVSNIMGIIVTFFLLIPCWITTFCYFSVGYKVNKQLNQMKKEAKINNDSNLITIIKKQKIKLIIQLIMVFMLYNCNFMISYITLFMKFSTGFKRPPLLDALSFAMGNATLAFNPILTITFQPELNNEFKIFLVKLRAKWVNSIRNLFNNQ